MWDSERTVSRQIKNTQKLSDSQKSARVLTPDSFHRGTSQHGRQSSTGARHSEPISGPSVLLTLLPHLTRTHTTQPTQQKHTEHCKVTPQSSQRLQMHAQTPTMHSAVHMRAHSNALRPCPPNPSQGALSRSPIPSRGPPRRSTTSDTGRSSVSSRRLGDCSGWFSSSTHFTMCSIMDNLPIVKHPIVSMGWNDLAMGSHRPHSGTMGSIVGTP